jgi:glycosyltransferase involved in cell wall biosynthesis
VLIAARQDVRWKGTDRFARAYKRAVSAGGEFLLAVSPWGDDTGLVQDALKHGPGDGVYVLPGVMSKPLLIDLYTVADVVVDQFVLGVHGSTMLEALACATPVMISLDVDRFRERWASWEEPPILNVATEDEIFAALMSIAAGEQGLAAMGRDGRAWVERVHGVENAHRFLPDDGGRQAPARIKNVRGEPETGGSAIPASGGSTRARP